MTTKITFEGAVALGRAACRTGLSPDEAVDQLHLVELLDEESLVTAAWAGLESLVGQVAEAEEELSI